MSARLFCKTGQLAGASYEIAGEATIGKNAENSIQLYPALVSGRHARIFFDNNVGCYMLEDLRSRNGTRLDGMRVTRKERLSQLHVITFANVFDFVFQTVEEGASVSGTKKQGPPQPKIEQSRKTELADDFAAMPVMKGEMKKTEELTGGQKTTLDDAMVPLPHIPDDQVPQSKAKVGEGQAARSKSEELVLEFQNLKVGKQTFKLIDGPNTIGRDPSCNIVIEDTSLSRNHALMTVSAGKVTIKDLGSKNHTFVGDKRVIQEVEVQLGVEITFGLVRAVLVQNR